MYEMIEDTEKTSSKMEIEANNNNDSHNTAIEYLNSLPYELWLKIIEEFILSVEPLSELIFFLRWWNHKLNLTEEYFYTNLAKAFHHAINCFADLNPQEAQKAIAKVFSQPIPKWLAILFFHFPSVPEISFIRNMITTSYLEGDIFFGFENNLFCYLKSEDLPMAEEFYNAIILAQPQRTKALLPKEEEKNEASLQLRRLSNEASLQLPCLSKVVWCCLYLWIQQDDKKFVNAGLIIATTLLKWYSFPPSYSSSFKQKNMLFSKTSKKNEEYRRYLRSFEVSYYFGDILNTPEPINYSSFIRECTSDYNLNMSVIFLVKAIIYANNLNLLNLALPFLNKFELKIILRETEVVASQYPEIMVRLWNEIPQEPAAFISYFEIHSNEYLKEFFAAVFYGAKKIAFFLFEAMGHLVNSSEICFRAFLLAIALGQLEIVKLLYDKGIDCFPKDKALQKNTILLAAISSNQPEVVKYILSIIKANNKLKKFINATYQTNTVPLAFACSIPTIEPEIISLLFESGARINNKMFNPLYTACTNNRKDVAEILLKNGASFEIPLDKEKKSVALLAKYEETVLAILKKAIEKNQVETIKWLMEKGFFSVQRVRFTLIDFLEKSDILKIITLELLKILLKDIVSYFSVSFIIPVAVKSEREDILSMLFEQNGKDEFFHISCWHIVFDTQSLKLLHLLIDFKSPINEIKQGISCRIEPLGRAYNNDNPDVFYQSLSYQIIKEIFLYAVGQNSIQTVDIFFSKLKENIVINLLKCKGSDNCCALEIAFNNQLEQMFLYLLKKYKTDALFIFEQLTKPISEYPKSIIDGLYLLAVRYNFRDKMELLFEDVTPEAIHKALFFYMKKFISVQSKPSESSSIDREQDSTEEQIAQINQDCLMLINDSRASLIKAIDKMFSIFDRKKINNPNIIIFFIQVAISLNNKDALSRIFIKFNSESENAYKIMEIAISNDIVRHAITKGFFEIIELLLEYATNEIFQKILTAIEDLFLVLPKSKLSLDQKKIMDITFVRAVKANNLDAVQKLAPHCNINACLSKGQNAVYCAAENGNEAMLKFLLDNGAHVTNTWYRREDASYTVLIPLSVALFKEAPYSVILLLLTKTKIQEIPNDLLGQLLFLAMKNEDQELQNLLTKHENFHLIVSEAQSLALSNNSDEKIIENLNALSVLAMRADSPNMSSSYQNNYFIDNFVDGKKRKLPKREREEEKRVIYEKRHNKEAQKTEEPLSKKPRITLQNIPTTEDTANIRMFGTYLTNKEEDFLAPEKEQKEQEVNQYSQFFCRMGNPNL